jgi:hypothetical protein
LCRQIIKEKKSITSNPIALALLVKKEKILFYIMINSKNIKHEIIIKTPKTIINKTLVMLKHHKVFESLALINSFISLTLLIVSSWSMPLLISSSFERRFRFNSAIFINAFFGVL